MINISHLVIKKHKFGHEYFQWPLAPTQAILQIWQILASSIQKKLYCNTQDYHMILNQIWIYIPNEISK